MGTRSGKISQSLDTVHKWFMEQGEVFIRVELWPAAGYTDYFLYTNYEQFVKDFKDFPAYYENLLEHKCVIDVIAIKNTYLPIRGIADDIFLDKAKQVFKKGEEFLFMFSTKSNVFSQCGHVYLEEEIKEYVEEHTGKFCIFGKEPDYNWPLKEDVEIKIRW